MKLLESITPELKEWAMKQQIFFSASAPLSGKHINVSPKGLPATSFSILGPNQCAYVDATGSGVETIANIFENRRVTIMFCSFNSSPRILRFFCTGHVIEYTEPTFKSWLGKMNLTDDKVPPGARAVILLNVYQVQTSCGYGVPMLTTIASPLDDDEQEKGDGGKEGTKEKGEKKEIAHLQDRATLGHWAGKKVKSDEMTNYQRDNNSRTLDKLPGLRAARRSSGETRLQFWAWDLRNYVMRSVLIESGRFGFVLYTFFMMGLGAMLTVLILLRFGLVGVLC